MTPVQGSVREANGHAVVTTRQEKLVLLPMCGGLRLTRDVPAGTPLREMMAEIPRHSLLWRLRREKDEGFPVE